MSYEKGKIYTIRSWSNPDLIYIGSTTQQLCRRFSTHNVKYRKWKENNEGKNLTSYSVIDCGDAYIELLETYPCSNRSELYKREGYWIREMRCVNKVIPSRSKKEYMDKYNQDNKHIIAEKKKKYYLDNREKFIQKAKENYEKNKIKITCECGSIIQKACKAIHLKSKKHQTYIQSQSN